MNNSINNNFANKSEKSTNSFAKEDKTLFSDKEVEKRDKSVYENKIKKLNDKLDQNSIIHALVGRIMELEEKQKKTGNVFQGHVVRKVYKKIPLELLKLSLNDRENIDAIKNSVKSNILTLVDQGYLDKVIELTHTLFTLDEMTKLLKSDTYYRSFLVYLKTQNKIDSLVKATHALMRVGYLKDEIRKEFLPIKFVEQNYILYRDWYDIECGIECFEAVFFKLLLEVGYAKDDLMKLLLASSTPKGEFVYKSRMEQVFNLLFHFALCVFSNIPKQELNTQLDPVLNESDELESAAEQSVLGINECRNMFDVLLGSDISNSSCLVLDQFAEQPIGNFLQYMFCCVVVLMRALKDVGFSKQNIAEVVLTSELFQKKSVFIIAARYLGELHLLVDALISLDYSKEDLVKYLMLLDDTAHSSAMFEFSNSSFEEDKEKTQEALERIFTKDEIIDLIKRASETVKIKKD